MLAVPGLGLSHRPAAMVVLGMGGCGTGGSGIHGATPAAAEAAHRMWEHRLRIASIALKDCRLDDAVKRARMALEHA